MGRKQETMAGEKPQKLDDAAVRNLANRLGSVEDLYLPRSLSSNGEAVSSGAKKEYLVSLLHRNAAIFLERYGKLLEMSELEHFDVLSDDYEVNWHLSQLRTSRDSTTSSVKSREKKVKNRRLAYMHRLLQEGSYFSEESIRERDPLVHYELIGRFRPLNSSAVALPGEKLSDTLIRQSQELEYQNSVRRECESQGWIGFPSLQTVQMDVEEEEEEEEEAEEEEDVGEMEEKEEEDTEMSESEEENAGAKNKSISWGEMEERKEKKSELKKDVHPPPMNHDSSSSMPIESKRIERNQGQDAGRRGRRNESERLQSFTVHHDVEYNGSTTTNTTCVLNDEELDENMKTLNRIMQEKFLGGEDSHFVDYVAIDSNAELDDDWILELSRDAEDKYFDED